MHTQTWNAVVLDSQLPFSPLLGGRFIILQLKRTIVEAATSAHHNNR